MQKPILDPSIHDPAIIWFVLAISGIIFIAGIIFFVAGLKTWSKKRLIENTPTSKIRSISMGLVEVYGEVLPYYGGLFKSPFSNKDCVYYKYTIEEQRRNKRGTYWVIIKQGTESTPFLLKDDTGYVLVDPKGAEVVIEKDVVYSSEIGKDPPQTVLDFLASKNISHDFFSLWNKTMRFTEYLISPSDKLYVMGTAGDNPFVAEGSSVENSADIMIHKGKNFYYISDKIEKQITGSLAFFAYVCLIAGFLLMLFGLFIIFASLNML